MNYDILKIHQKSSVIKAEGNQFTSFKNQDVQRFGVRRFDNGKMFQSSRIGAANLDRLLADSKEWGGPGSPHDFGFAPDYKKSQESALVTSEQFKIFQEVVLETIAQFPDFVFAGQCQVEESVVSLTSDYGLDLSSTGGVCNWHLIFQRRGSGTTFDGYIEATSSQPQIREVMREQHEYFIAQKKEATLKAGHYPVLFVDHMTPFNKLIDSISVQPYAEGSALYSGQLGKQLFSPAVTLVDRAYEPKLGRLQFFDGEGTVRKDNDLKVIDKGVFKSILADRRFGKKYGFESTGNGFRKFNTGVRVAPQNLIFTGGEKPWREIVKGLDRCILATVAAGGDSNDLGEFSAPVQVGYVFEKGELVGRAPQLTVKSSLQAYLNKNLIAVSSDSFSKGTSSGCVISEMQVLLN